jgi:hypothetical protein
MKFNLKKYRIGYSLLILTILISSCKKDLVEDNKGGFVKSNYFTTASQAQTFVNGIYQKLYMFQNGDAYGESPFITMELFAGHATSLGQSVNNNNVINNRTDGKIVITLFQMPISRSLIFLQLLHLPMRIKREYWAKLIF